VLVFDLSMVWVIFFEAGIQLYTTGDFGRGYLVSW